MVNRLGRVDDGTTVTDHDPEAIARKHTLSTSLAFAEWRKTKINLLDTPGVGNFFADTSAALRVADAALVVVDAVAGAAVQTEKAWASAEELGLPRVVAVNRLDRDRASLDAHARVAAPLLQHRNVVPVHLPIGEGEACRGIVDLVGMKAFVAPVDGGPAVEGPVPEPMAAEVAAARVGARRDGRRSRRDADRALLRRRHPERPRPHHRPAAARPRPRQLFPLVCTSALRNVGIDAVLNAILSWLPTAADRPFRALDARAPTSAAAGGRGRRRRRPSCGRRWPTSSPGRITLFRVYQGTLTSDSTVRNAHARRRRTARQPDR